MFNILDALLPCLTEIEGTILLIACAGEYPTFDEAQDAHNLLALMHEGQNALLGLTASTVRIELL